MFTGIIEATATVMQNQHGSLTLTRPATFNDLSIGMSICNSGVCLSITEFDASSMTFDVIDATRSKSTLGKLKKGDRVNLERALPANGRFDGHIVLGHCEAVGKVLKAGTTVVISIPSPLRPYVVPHGSITINGVSLTIASLEQSTVTVALIPLTLEGTNLGELKTGDIVNIETDILGRYILHNHHAKRRSS
ncbi:MAG: riboflavin synthase [Candidatus Peribacteraceae bacterium]|nr:riboflavin synthase [Candidatus Peribacteraceae bacterium]